MGAPRPSLSPELYRGCFLGSHGLTPPPLTCLRHAAPNIASSRGQLVGELQVGLNSETNIGWQQASIFSIGAYSTPSVGKADIYGPVGRAGRV